MTQVFDEVGRVVPVTVIEAGPCHVVQVKSLDKDGYAAVQLGFGDVKPKHVTKPLKGHFDHAGVPARKWLREFHVATDEEYHVGQIIAVDTFAPGDKVDVTATSLGKGFQGVIKRHHFRRGPTTHGSKYHRRVGSLGASSDPSRVFKGRRLPGRMGSKQRTVQNLTVVRSDPERNLLLVKGSVPGRRGAFVMVRSTNKMISR